MTTYRQHCAQPPSRFWQWPRREGRHWSDDIWHILPHHKYRDAFELIKFRQPRWSECVWPGSGGGGTKYLKRYLTNGGSLPSDPEMKWLDLEKNASGKGVCGGRVLNFGTVITEGGNFQMSLIYNKLNSKTCGTVLPNLKYKKKTVVARYLQGSSEMKAG